MNETMPITQSQAKRAHEWLQTNFGQQIVSACENTHYTPVHVSAIFCQETAQRVQLWFNDYDPATILKRCVFDASGDFPGTKRNAFPKNAAEFHTTYGDSFTDMLIAEGNAMRAMPQPGHKDGYGEAHYLYKAYGLFQYDLQHVKTDEAFFRQKAWYYFDECLKRLFSELLTKWKGDLRDNFRRYNGAGRNAENYADNVMRFVEWLD